MSLTDIPPGTDLSQIPAGVPPTGIVPNFVNPLSLAPVVLGINVSFIAVTGIFVICRMIANITKKRVAGADDLFCMLGYVGCIAWSALWMSMNKYARHQWDIPVSWLLIPGYYKVILYPSTFFAKLSILLLYHRVFSTTPRMKWGINGGILLNFLLYIPNIIVTCWYCAPHRGQSWDYNVATRCTDTEVWYVAQAVLIVILDLYIFALPLTSVVRLHMTPKRKLAIIAVFGTASLAVVAAVAQLANRPKLWKSADQTWYSSVSVICTSVEIYISILVGCAPAFSCFAQAYIIDRKFFPSLRSRLMPSRKTAELSGKPWPYSNRKRGQNDTESASNLRNEYISLDGVPKGGYEAKVEGVGGPVHPNSHGIIRSIHVSQGVEEAFK